MVYLYLSAQSTHLLQSLDIDVFSFLKQNYKTLLTKKTQFITYNLDKANFVSLIQKTLKQGINSQNIQLA